MNNRGIQRISFLESSEYDCLKAQQISLEFRSFSSAMKKDVLIQKTQAYIREKLNNESSGHDWWHIFRVWQLSKIIAEAEGPTFF